jgi:hypothetical protein
MHTYIHTNQFEHEVTTHYTLESNDLVTQLTFDVVVYLCDSAAGTCVIINVITLPYCMCVLLLPLLKVVVSTTTGYAHDCALSVTAGAVTAGAVATAVACWGSVGAITDNTSPQASLQCTPQQTHVISIHLFACIDCRV